MKKFITLILILVAFIGNAQTVKLNFPTNGSVISTGKTTFGAIATNVPANNTLEFYDGATRLYQEKNNGTEWYYDWNTTNVSNGVHDLTAKVTFTNSQNVITTIVSNVNKVTIQNGGQTVFTNDPQSGVYVRNNCTTGTGSSVTYTVNAGTYTSIISKADANSKAYADVIANGQTFANQNGTCSTNNSFITMSQLDSAIKSLGVIIVSKGAKDSLLFPAQRVFAPLTKY